MENREEKVETSTQEVEKAPRKSLKDWCDEHPKAVFAIRCVLWIISAAVLPFLFIAWRYGIFTNSSKMSLTGWGFIAIIIVVIFIITFIKYICKALKPGFAKQCIVGFVTIILPLTVLYLLVCSVEDTIALFKQALGCVIICELVGIPLNPFPAWLEQKRVADKKEEADTMTDIFWKKFFDKKKEEE